MSMRATCRERFRKTKDGRRVSKGWYVRSFDGQKQIERKAKDRESAERMVAQINAAA